MKWISLLALCLPLVLFADARIDPDECHVPWDNGNTDNEHKFQNCSGLIMQYAGGGRADGHFNLERTRVPTSYLARMGIPIREPGNTKATFLVRTSGAESGTACNLVTAEGQEYATASWTAEILVKRTGDYNRADVEYVLICSGGRAQ